MPEATKYITDQASRAYADLEESYNREMRRRQKEYKEGWNYYYGAHKKHLKDDGFNTDDNLIINLVELAIDKGVSSLMGTTEQGTVKGPDFDVIGDDPGEPGGPVQRAVRAVRGIAKPQKSNQQLYLDRVWEANQKSLLLHDMAVNGAICGQVYMKIVPESTPDPDDPAEVLPRLIVLNPGNIATFWDAGDTAKALWYRIQYGREGTRKRQDIVSDDALADTERESGSGGWTVIDYDEGVNGSRRGWSQTKKEAWPYPWPPVVEWKNLPKPNEHYGLDDIRNNGNLNDGLNFVASNTQRIIKHHAHPRTIGTGIGDQKTPTPTGIDRFWTYKNAEAKIYNLEMSSDLGSSLNFMGYLRRSFFDGTRELDPGTVQDKLGAMTNFGLRVLYRDTLEKVGTKRLLYGHALRCVCRYVLELGGYGANLKVVDKWSDPLPSDALLTAQALQIDRVNGLSQSSYLEKRGYDPESEAQKREDEMGEQMMAQTLGRQGSLLDTLRNKNGQQPFKEQPNGQSMGMMGR